MILVDTSVWISYFNGEISEKANALDYLLGKELILIGDLVLAEVLRGFRQDDHFNAAMQVLGNLEIRDIGGEEMAIMAAHNYRLLRNKGIKTHKMLNMFVGTYCIAQGLTLLHSHPDFDHMEEQLGLTSY
ncbi:MAG: PIN domain nuclease [Pseudomonadota bacterium]